MGLVRQSGGWKQLHRVEADVETLHQSFTLSRRGPRDAVHDGVGLIGSRDGDA